MLIYKLVALITVLFLTTPTIANGNPNPEELVKCLEKSFVNNIVPPSNETYDALRLQFNLKFDSYPAAIVKAVTEYDIKASLHCSRITKIRAVPRNGGHSFEGTSTQNGTLLIDLALMNSITVSPDNTTITAQGGAFLGDVYYAAWDRAGKGFNGGTCPPVGISGFLFGGGYGYYSRAFGMGCDNVISFTMITWEGKTLVADPLGLNRDLYWAACGGGGGNFGIITQWNIKLIDVPEILQYGSVRFDNSTETTVDVWTYYQTWAASADPNLGMSLNFGSDNSQARILMYYIGPDNLTEYINTQTQLMSFSNATASYSRISYIRAVLQGTGWGLSKPENLTNADWTTFRVSRKEKSFYIYKPMTKELTKKMIELWQEYPSASIKIHPYGGAIAKKSDNSTAFPHRQNALGLIQIQAVWSPPDNTTQQQIAVDWIDRMNTLLVDGMDQPVYSYVNYLDDEVKNWQNAYFGLNYKRLQQVKSRYDPFNFFTFPVQGIQPSKPRPCKYYPCLN